MKSKLITLGVILWLIIPITSFIGIAEIHADDEQQSANEQNVIDPYLEKILAGMSPSDNISVIVCLKRDPSLDQQIQAIWQGQPDDEMHTISEHLTDKLRKVSEEMKPYEEQLRAGDPAAIEKYKELLKKYGINDASIQDGVQRLTDLHTIKSRQIDALHEQAYAEMQKQAKQRIEQLPDTKIISSTFIFNNFGVETKAGNIQALAAIPDVVMIFENAKIVPAIGPYLGLLLLSPNNGSKGITANPISFSWKPYKDTTKYKLALAKDAAMTQIVEEATLTGSSYVYDGKLDYSTNYFWRVMALEPTPSDWSATFGFQTETAPTPVLQAPWSPILIAGLVIGFAAAIGILTWFLVNRSHRGKMKTGE